MKTRQPQLSSQYLPIAVGPNGWWSGAGLALAAVVAITIAISVSAPPASARPMLNRLSSVGAERVRGAAVQPVTTADAAQGAMSDDLRANGVGLESQGQGATHYLRGPGAIAADIYPIGRIPGGDAADHTL